MKTKEQIKAYNKEYFARPEVIARAKIRNAQRRDKRKAYKKTEKGRQKENEYRNRRYAKDGYTKRIYQRYGLTKEEYDHLLHIQGGLCAICLQESKTKLHVDHCHNTGKVRGLLCGNCNRALGLFKDNVLYLENAKNYLKK